MEDIVPSETLVRQREENEVEDNVEREKRLKVEVGNNGNGTEKEKEIINVDDDVTNNNNDQDGVGCGGLLDNLLSKLTSPRAPKPATDGEDFEAKGFEPEGEGQDGTKGSENGGGGFKDMISNFFHHEQNGGDVGKENGEKNGAVEESVAVKSATNLENEGGATSATNGGIISNLVPEDAAPAADEASILIHSVVHD